MKAWDLLQDGAVGGLGANKWLWILRGPPRKKVFSFSAWLSFYRLMHTDVFSSRGVQTCYFWDWWMFWPFSVFIYRLIVKCKTPRRPHTSTTEQAEAPKHHAWQCHGHINLSRVNPLPAETTTGSVRSFLQQLSADRQSHVDTSSTLNNLYPPWQPR